MFRSGSGRVRLWEKVKAWLLRAAGVRHTGRLRLETGEQTRQEQSRPSTVLLAGVELLDPVLAPSGFKFELDATGCGSGGEFARGAYVRGDRRLELHFRHSLGLVEYCCFRSHLTHELYLRALGVPPGQNRYPGFSDDPLDGFRHLAHDLEHFCGEFLSGDGSVLRRGALAEVAHAAARQRVYQAGAEGDEQKRREARTHFRAGEYSRTVALLEDVHYPDLLTTFERRMLELARRRAGGIRSGS